MLAEKRCADGDGFEVAVTEDVLRTYSVDALFADETQIVLSDVVRDATPYSEVDKRELVRVDNTALVHQRFPNGKWDHKTRTARQSRRR